MDTSNTKIFSWQAPEYKHHPKGFWWHIALFFFTGTLASVQILRQDYFGAVLLGVIAILIALLGRRKPEVIDIHIDSQGIQVADIHLPYKHIRKFWVVDDGKHKTLNLETSTYMHRFVVLELHEQEATPVKEFLSQILPEHDFPHPTFSQWLAHKVRF